MRKWRFQRELQELKSIILPHDQIVHNYFNDFNPFEKSRQRYGCILYLQRNGKCLLRAVSGDWRHRSKGDAFADAITIAIEKLQTLKSEEWTETTPTTNKAMVKPPKLKQIAEEKEEAPNMCVICRTKKYEITFIPCGHLCACAPCAYVALSVDSRCVICRQEVEYTCQTYLA